jgi:hypothetical protein
MAELREWESFYVMLGGAAAALIGLQFVVLTLIAERPPADARAAGAAFATPTVVHFGTTLLISALWRAPWQAVASVSVLSGVIGIAGIAYTFVVVGRMRIQKAYQPQFEDWLFYVLLPLAAYATLVTSAFIAASQIREALFGIGAAALALLFIGIRNAWDAVTYHVLVNLPSGKESMK